MKFQLMFILGIVAMMCTACRLPHAPAEGGNDASVDEYHREPRPSFDIKQTEAERQSIVSDGKSHTIAVLFSDKLTARVKQNEAQVRDSNGNGIVLSEDYQAEYAALNDILDDFPSLIYSSHFKAVGMTEDQLLADELKWSAALGGDYPNDGSWAFLTLDPYSSEAILDLAHRLDGLSFVRMAQIQPTIIGTGASLSSD